MINGLEDQIKQKGIKGYDKGTTRSPWIFNELIVANIIRKKSPDRYKIKKKEIRYSSEEFFSKQENTLPKFEYQLEGLDDLIRINRKDLIEWKGSDFEKGNKALNVLYKIKGMHHG